MDHTTPHGAGRALATNGARYGAITRLNVAQTGAWEALAADVRETVRTVSTGLALRTNESVLRERIDCSRVPVDPIFQLTTPQRGLPRTASRTDHASRGSARPALACGVLIGARGDEDHAAMRALLGRADAAVQTESEAHCLWHTLNPRSRGPTTRIAPRERKEREWSAPSAACRIR